MSWTFVFLSYLIPTVLLFVFLMLDWGAEGHQIEALSAQARKAETDSRHLIHGIYRGREKKGDHQWQSDFKQEF